MNDYYNAPVVPVDYTLARADQIRQQLAGVAGGFDKLPLPQDLHENRIGFVVAEGTANAITVELTAAPLSYEDGMTLKLGITATNTGPATMNVNGLGVVPIVGRLINPLTAGDLVVGTVETMIYYAGKFIIREVSGAQGPQGEVGPEGPLNGRTILNGAGVPDAGTGDDGDFYIRTGVWTIYGPKTAGAWGAATNIIGPIGPDGNDGNDGANGKTVLNGAGAPAGGTGVDGDFYIDTTADAIYGPKTAGAWGAATSLIGPPGADGIDGIDGTGGSWNDLADRPEHLTDIAALVGVDGGLIKFTGPNSFTVQTLADMIAALDAPTLGDIAGSLGAIRIQSMALTSPGYIRFLLPDGTHAIFQWGASTFNGNANTTINYPCPTAYTAFSVAVVSSANVKNDAQDNTAQVVSCGLTSFVAFSAVDTAKPGFWMAWGI